MIEFVVPGIPVPQPRVKATRRGNHTGVYTPTKTATGASNGVSEFKAAIRLIAASMRRGPLLMGPIRVELVFVFPRQSAKIWKTRPMPPYWKTTKPDADNLAKAALDALTGVLWIDDCQVCDLSIEKLHCGDGQSPHVSVKVTELEN